MKYQNILFDLDGTLIDSGEGIMNSAAYAFAQLGLMIPESRELRKMVGPPLRIAFPLLGVPQNKVEDAVRLYRDKYNNQGCKYQYYIYSGIEDMVKKLKEAGYILYVATSKPETLAREILVRVGLDKYFEYIAGATLDCSRESKGEVLKYLLDIIGDGQNAVMVGDTNYDIIGAHELQLPCIGVSWGYGAIADMIVADAEAIVDSPEMLFSYLSE